MKLQEKQKELEQEIIANLRAIPKMPEGLLPHTVYVEEEGEEDEHHGIPVYTAYKLEEIRPDGSCMLYNPDSRERFPCRHLYEINIDWLVTVWERYLELCVGQKLWKQNAVAFLKESTDKTEAEISAFVDSGWDRCSAYTDNLKRFLGKDEVKEVWMFSFPMDDFGRDAPDKEIIFDYENNPHTEVEKMTPLEFTARINDEMFNDQDNWVRAIELPEHK